jgi:hypothetical protein
VQLPRPLPRFCGSAHVKNRINEVHGVSGPARKNNGPRNLCGTSAKNPDSSTVSTNPREEPEESTRPESRRGAHKSQRSRTGPDTAHLPNPLQDCEKRQNPRITLLSLSKAETRTISCRKDEHACSPVVLATDDQLPGYPRLSRKSDPERTSYLPGDKTLRILKNEKKSRRTNDPSHQAPPAPNY